MNRKRVFGIVGVLLLLLATVVYIVYAYLFPNPELEMQTHDNSNLQADTLVTGSGQSIGSLTTMIGDFVSEVDSSELFFINGGGSGTTGKFKDFVVNINTEGSVNSMQIEVVIEAKSIYTFNDLRDSHLQGEEFFDTSKFPKISFLSKEIQQTDTAYLAIGSMTFLGIENEVKLPFKYLGKASYPVGNEYHVLEGGFTFNPEDFGMEVGITIADVSEVRFYLEMVELK